MDITINVTINFAPEQTVAENMRGRRHLTPAEAQAKQIEQEKQQDSLLRAQLHKQRLTEKLEQLFGKDTALQYQAGVL
ncbi:hypothetical protein [Pseudomonas monteilii]|uniref:hypothetical protein n=1 Tax=Pseudomonas monteilii TaxID=76759 RepID=UPI00048D7F83|nr:hypothetical protein [Pseudomonas monteilii]